MADRVIRGVANIWVPIADIERAVDFYENSLGLEVVKRDGPWAEVDANGVTIGLNGREPEGTQAEGGPVLTFRHGEGSLEGAVEELKSRGVEFPAEISEHSWGRVATFKDSEGNDLQLYEPPSS
jgi:catechol 2,3-dioxygenase-like lactoylglutathione lyase family enzyme